MGKALKTLSKQKGRFVGLPFEVVGSNIWTDLTAQEVKLLVDLMHQYNGRNNGMLSACYTLMKPRGWAKASLYRAFSGLQHKGFVVITRTGRPIKGWPTLVAVTFSGINEPRQGLSYDSWVTPSDIPLSWWSKAKKSWKKKPSCKDPREKSILSNMENKTTPLYSDMDPNYSKNVIYGPFSISGGRESSFSQPQTGSK